MVERFQMKTEHDWVCARPDPKGDWVHFSDYEALQAELEQVARDDAQNLADSNYANICTQHRQIEDLTTRAEAAERLAGTRVKALEWSTNWGTIKAETPIGHYFVEARRDGSFDCRLENVWKTWASSSDAAKAAAQADYERRVLSALAEPAGEAEKDEIPIAADENREVDWVDVTGWGVFKGHAIPVDVARYIATKINLYAEHRTAPPDASAIRGALDIPECVLSLCADKITLAFETSEEAGVAFDAIEAALAGAKP